MEAIVVKIKLRLRGETNFRHLRIKDEGLHLRAGEQRLGGDLRAQVAQFFFESFCSSFAVDCAFETLDLRSFAMSRHVRSCYLRLKVA